MARNPEDTGSANKSDAKRYKTPTVRSYGNIQQITKMGPAGTMEDNAPKHPLPNKTGL